MRIHNAIPLLTLLLISGCADTLYPTMGDYMASKKLKQPTIASFPHCQNYDCAVVKNVTLGKSEWKAIDKAFGKKAKSAEQEREKIAKTIGVFEQVLGPITRTEDDKEGTFVQTGDGQLDCVDESTNTTVYLTLLQQKGLIKFHEIGQPEVRYPLISGRGWMHQTAVLTDTKTNERYAVDSWFEDNGAPAYIVPLETWRNGWTPEAEKGPNQP